MTPDGRTAVSGSVDQTVILWRTDDGEFVRRFHGHNATVNAVALSSDARLGGWCLSRDGFSGAQT